MIRKLMLMRHGTYNCVTGGLNEKGRMQVADIAAQLADNDLIPDTIMHSPLKRTSATAMILKSVFNRRAETSITILSQDWLAASNYSSLKNIRHLDGEESSILLVSHELNIMRILSDLRHPVSSLRTAQVYAFEKEAANWRAFKRPEFVAEFIAGFTPR